MAKVKYYYDTEKLTYEKVKTKPIDIIISILAFVVLSIISGIILTISFSGYYKSGQEQQLRADNAELKLQYEVLTKEINEVESILTALQARDVNTYRVIFEADPPQSFFRNKSEQIAAKYHKILNGKIKHRDLLENIYKKITKVRRKMYEQSKSYDDISKLVKNKAKMLASMPAIQPVSNKQLTRLTSGFGMRYHPIYKVAQFHPGIDFAAPHGTPIYATADGVVKKANYNAGYGNAVVLDHGYNYKTMYAHMSSFKVKEGQKVKRGECIGYVGSTGFSTAPHVHYEVHYKGDPVNPVYFFFNDLTADEYEKVLELASIENESLS